MLQGAHTSRPVVLNVTPPRAEQAWIRRRATSRLVTLDEDCAELRKLSRVYEIIAAGLPEARLRRGEG